MNPDHRVYPYLPRGLTIERPHQVWSADIDYIPGQGGFLYLVAIMDWASRRVLAWRLSNTMDTAVCRSAWRRWRRLWKATAFRRSSIPIRAASSPASRSRASWRRPGYVYLRDLEDGFEAQRVIGEWVEFSNETRPHSALGGRTPAEAYRDGLAEQQQEVAWRTGAAGGRHGGARASEGERERERWEQVIHIFTGSFTRSPDPTPFTAA